MTLAPLQSRQAAANARGAPSFAFSRSSSSSQSRASVAGVVAPAAAARPPFPFLLAQKQQQPLSKLGSPIRGGSLIAMAAGECV